MAKKKVGELIREARTSAGYTQEQLAKKITGLSASDISKAERGEKDLTQDELKQIAKLTGVTQKSLLDAAKGTSSSSSKTSKTSSSSGTSMKLTAAEKRLVELYRAADTNSRKEAIAALKGEKSDLEAIFGTLLGGAVDMLGKK